jgi:ABC-2 type transport system permease protein
MIGVLAGKELRRLFASPLAWVILASLQVLFAFFFLLGLQQFLSTQAQMQMQMMQGESPGFTVFVVGGPFGVARILLLMVIPLLSARLIAEERRNQTFPFLVSSPLSITQIVLGKFLAIVAFLGITLALLSVMALSLYAAGRLDHGLLIGNVLGLLLLSASFAAVGLFLSTLTAQWVIAAVGTYAVLLGLWLIDAGTSDPNSWLHAFSMIRHGESLSRGVLAINDVVYYVVVIVLFLLLSIRRLDADRLRV